MTPPRSFTQSDVPPRMLAHILDHHPTGLILTDENSNIVAANSFALEHLSSSTNETDQLGIQTEPPADRLSSPPEKQPLGPLFREHSFLRLTEGSRGLKHSDGSNRLVWINQSKLDSLPSGWTLTRLTDAGSEIKRAFYSAEATGQDTTRYLAREVAHELNGRIGAILMALETLQNNDPGEKERLQLISNSVTEIQSVASNLRHFARGQQTERKGFSLSEMTAGIQRTIQALVPPTATVEFKVPPTELELRGDPTEIAQVLLRLFGCCVQALESSDRFRYEAKAFTLSQNDAPRGDLPIAPGRYVEIRISGTLVRDEVPGPQLGLNLFVEPSGRHQTMELGLKYCQTIIAAYGGFLASLQDHDSRAGFRVLIPAQPEERGKESHPPAASPSQKESILFVDDDPSYTRLASRFLSLPGIEILTAANGEQAVQILNQHQCSIAIVDLNLAGTSGLSLIKKARLLDPALRIIVITGLLSPDDETALNSMNITAILSKPFKKEALQNEVLAQLKAGKRQSDQSPGVHPEP